MTTTKIRVFLANAFIESKQQYQEIPGDVPEKNLTISFEYYKPAAKNWTSDVVVTVG